jgi:hypothetical protein
MWPVDLPISVAPTQGSAHGGLPWAWFGWPKASEVGVVVITHASNRIAANWEGDCGWWREEYGDT